MKYYALITIMLLGILSLGACSDDNITSITETPDNDQPVLTTGDIHTEFLNALHQSRQLKSSGPIERLDACTMVANQILNKYGEQPMTRKQVQAGLNYGRDLATRMTEVTMEGVLSGDDLAWWDRYSWEARTTNARKVYNKHCRLYGAPAPGSTLEDVMTTIVSSCEIWTEYRPEEECYMPQEQINNGEKGWVKNLIRFAVAVGVDGVAGGLAGAGAAGATGGNVAVGAVAAGVVGGLASEGADNILFGD